MINYTKIQNDYLKAFMKETLKGNDIKNLSGKWLYGKNKIDEDYIYLLPDGFHFFSIPKKWIGLDLTKFRTIEFCDLLNTRSNSTWLLCEKIEIFNNTRDKREIRKYILDNGSECYLNQALLKDFGSDIILKFNPEKPSLNLVYVYDSYGNFLGGVMPINPNALIKF